MTPGGLAAGVAGAGFAGGVACVVAYAGGYPPAPLPGTPRRGFLRRHRITPRLAAAALAAGVAAFAVTGWPVAGIAAVPAVIAVPRILSRKGDKARIAKLGALESWTRRLADVLAASRGLEDALIVSASQVPGPIEGPVRTLASRLRTGAMPTAAALGAFADAINDPVGDLVASALKLASERRGPGLRAVLTELAADVAKDVAGRREVEAERASYRSALLWIVVFLAGYTVFLLAAKSYSAPFGTPAGQLVLLAVAGCWAAGLYWLHRLALMNEPQRFLHGADTPGPGRPS